MSGSLADDRTEDAQATEVAPSPEEARAELERLLQDDRFKATDRRRSMLHFVVEETLAGHENSIKGVAIAQAVFGRGADFDQQSDSIVRIEARRLRQDLDLYYLGPGRDSPVRISIPKGRYVPSFTRLANLHQRSEPSPSARRFSHLPRVWLGVGVAALLLIVTTAAIAAFMERSRGDGPPDHGPSVAILQFEPTSESETVKQLAKGLTYELIADLTRFPHFRVFAPAPSAASEDSIGTDYVLSGTVGMSPDSVHLVAKLTHSATGEVVWGRIYDEELSTRSLLDFQREVAGHIATMVAPTDGIVHKRLAALRDGKAFEASLPSYQCVLQAYDYRRNLNYPDFGSVKACLLDAVDREPDYAEAWGVLAWIYFDEVRFQLGETREREQALTKARASASQSLTLDPNNVQAIKALAAIHHFQGDFEQSWLLGRKALASNPNDPNTLFQLGWRLAVRGHFDEGTQLVEEAISRSVRPRPYYFHALAVHHLMNGDYEAMLAAAEHGRMPCNGLSQSLLTIAHNKNGNIVAARQALDLMETVDPVFARDPEAYYRAHRATDEIIDALLNGLQSAGWTPPSTVISASDT